MRRREWLIAGLLLVLSLFVAGQAQALTVLRRGNRSPEVRGVQCRLALWGYYGGTLDSIFGFQTFEAIKKFQRNNGLQADGIVGPQTWFALGYPTEQECQRPASIADPKPRVASPEPARGFARADDRDLLARVVSAEARGESYEGQVAVAAVVLNRARDPRFPASIQSVILQAHAFESVSRGTVAQPPTQDSVRAVTDALAGQDPTGGAVFFWNPNTARSTWVRSLTVVKRIGNHVFAR